MTADTPTAGFSAAAATASTSRAIAPASRPANTSIGRQYRSTPWHPSAVMSALDVMPQFSWQNFAQSSRRGCQGVMIFPVYKGVVGGLVDEAAELVRCFYSSSWLLPGTRWRFLRPLRLRLWAVLLLGIRPCTRRVRLSSPLVSLSSSQFLLMTIVHPLVFVESIADHGLANTTGIGWEEAFAKAKDFLAELTLEEKTALVTGTTGPCAVSQPITEASRSHQYL